ncbi:MAG: T9SS type A sorting domain-containing protein [Flavobacteriales bacterium]|nr:T9SS type A sorting domain-containing protein [Flavobacteriales bacterium]
MMWIFRIVIFGWCWALPAARAQFAPPAGQPGSTAIPQDSSAFVAWATGCTVERGPQDISNLSLGYTTVGDSASAIGPAGQNGVVSLGDGGRATLTFAVPIADGPGWDFAVFENAFNDNFLELAFVEVSSDGQNFFRFPATSLTQDTLQVGPFGSVDAAQIDNLAGKYRAGFGTPFDLEQLSGTPGLNIQSITHVRIVDVVGSIQPAYATFDKDGRKVNDPWNTPFPSGGFDLDAVGVIHTAQSVGLQYSEMGFWALYPNPAREFLFIQPPPETRIHQWIVLPFGGGAPAQEQAFMTEKTVRLEIHPLPPGMYILKISTDKGDKYLKFLKL